MCVYIYIWRVYMQVSMQVVEKFYDVFGHLRALEMVTSRLA